VTKILANVRDLEWSSLLRRGDRVLWGQACAEPVTLTRSLMAERTAVGPFSCFLGVPATGTCRPEHADVVTFESYTGAGANRALWRAGHLEILPSPYSALPDLFRSGRLPVDVVLLLLPPQDEHGRYSLGLADEYVSAALDSARVVVAEVSDRVPRTLTSRTVTDDDLDVVVRTSRAPAELVHPLATATQEAIAARVADLIEDEATLQVGIGALPDAVVRALTGHRDLGVHSGAYTDALAELAEAGVVTNARKPVDTGFSVAGVVMGGARVLRHVHDNPAVQLRPTEYTHDPAVLVAQHKLVALNAAVEVDLSGQVNAEVAAGVYVGAYGGALDFARGARRSPGGLPIVLLPATAGNRSRVVPELTGPVSTTRAEAGAVVTEYGVADLRGLTLSQRREAILAIAHPAHRDRLAASARGVPGAWPG
jgi:acyl-CoA hydrolase